MQGACNFALYSCSASTVSLVLFSNADLMAGRPTAEIQLDHMLNRTGNIWHIAVPGIPVNYLYGAPPRGLFGSCRSAQRSSLGRRQVERALHALV